MEERTKSGGEAGVGGPAFSRILMLCAGAFAVEAAYMIEEGYAIPAMLATGLPETVASAMWAVGPLLGFFFQGYLGSASDRCTCSWGKRRPFILSLAACACIAILLFPYGSFFVSVLKLGEGSGGLFVMAFTASTFVAMDFFLDALQSPLRAYLLDSVPAEGSERANYTYTALLCAGAIAGSLIAGVPWSSFARRRGEEEGGREGERSRSNSGRQLEIVYGIATGLFVVCMLLCLNSVREKKAANLLSPPVEREIVLPLAGSKSAPVLLESGTALVQPASIQVVTKDNSHLLGEPYPATKHENGLLRCPSPNPLRRAPPTTIVPPLSSKTSKDGGCIARFLGNIYEDIHETVIFSSYTSTHFSRLCWAVFFSWVAYLSMLLYFTSFMGEVVYGGSPHSPTESRERELFERGVQVGILVMLFQDFISAVSCVSMKFVSDGVGIRQLSVGVLVAYTATCFLAASLPSLLTAVLLQIAAGLLYSNMQALPYTLLSHYEVCLFFVEFCTDFFVVCVLCVLCVCVCEVIKKFAILD